MCCALTNIPEVSRGGVVEPSVVAVETDSEHARIFIEYILCAIPMMYIIEGRESV